MPLRCALLERVGSWFAAHFEKPEASIELVDVAQQGDGWRCGYHTLWNAASLCGKRGLFGGVLPEPAALRAAITSQHWQEFWGRHFATQSQAAAAEAQAPWPRSASTTPATTPSTSPSPSDSGLRVSIPAREYAEYLAWRGSCL